MNDAMNIIGQDSPSGQWHMKHPWPTQLVAQLHGKTPPTMQEVLQRLADFLGCEISFLPDVPGIANDATWSARIEVPQLPSAIAVWVEPSTMSPPHTASASAWSLSMQSVLHEPDPLSHWINLVRLLVAAADDATAILDVNTALWHDMEALNATALQDVIDPETSILWTVHVVESDQGHWIHTHGLGRCGKPELDLIGVDAGDVGLCVDAIDDIAQLILETGLPEPGGWLEIADGIPLSPRPWQDVVAEVPGGMPGGAEDRDDGEHEHGGIRAVLGACDDTAPPWQWPKETLHQLFGGTRAIYRSAHATHRLVTAVNATWSTFLLACCNHPAQVQIILVDPSGEDDRREHAPAQVVAVTGERIDVQLLQTPAIAQGVEEDGVITVGITDVSDFHLLIDGVVVGPLDLLAQEQGV